MIRVQKWEPGTLAVIPFTTSDERGLWDGEEWLVAGGRSASSAYTISRLLPVIDYENREEVERLAAIYAGAESARSGDEYRAWDNRSREAQGRIVDTLAAALREYANTTPPIEEPTDPAARVLAHGTTWAKVGLWWVSPAMEERPREWDYLAEADDFEVTP